MIGADHIAVEVKDRATIGDLRAALQSAYSVFDGRLIAMRFAVNQTFVTDDCILQPEDEVALIPPVSGG